MKEYSIFSDCGEETKKSYSKSNPFGRKIVRNWRESSGVTKVVDDGNGITITDRDLNGEKKSVRVSYSQFADLVEAYFIWKHEGHIIHTFSIHEKALVVDERGIK